MKVFTYSFFLFSFILLKPYISLSQVGLLSLCDDLNMASTSSFEVEISDLTGAGTGHDQITVGGDLNLDGTLDILLSGYVPDVMDEFEIMSYDGTLTGTFTSINWPNDMISQGWLIDYGVLNPGKITIYASSTVPIELLSFSVALVNNRHELEWETAIELNNKYFAVEFSTDGVNFSVLDHIEGQGTSNSHHQYSYSHTPTQYGQHYYRLKQVDWDGRFEYSDIISIFSKNEKEVSFYPNPASSIITFNESKLGLSVYNLTGQIVKSIEIESTTFDISGLPSGTYFIRSKGLTTWTKQLIIK